MRNNTLLTASALALLAALAAAAAAPPALAKDVKTDVDGHFYQLPEGAKNNLDAVRILVLAANTVNMARIATAAGNDITEGDATRLCVGCTTDMYEYRGSGLFDGTQAKDVRIHFDLKMPAVRTDVTAADGSETVTVAKDKLTWDEKTPGVFKGASTASSAERMIPVYLLPPAAIVLGAASADKIKAGKTATGAPQLVVPVPALGTNLTATLDGNGYVVHTELQYGGKLYSGDYSDFTNDRMDYHVYGPGHVVQKVDGKVVTDLAMAYTWVNPYMIFSTPKEIASK